MKRVLFIAPHSYPIMSSESICNSKVAYTLAKVGYKVDVYTCSSPSTYPTDERIDGILRDSENLSITTVTACLITRKQGVWILIKRLIHYLKIFFETGYFYNGLDYPYQIVKAIERRVKKEGTMPYDVMITRGFHTDYAGIYMKRRYGLKWISNWNDPFPVIKFPAPYGNGPNAKLPHFEQTLYDDIQKYSDVFTFPSERLRDYMLKCFTHISKGDTVIIHHMALKELSINKKKDNSRVRFVHSGSVKKPRNPEIFLRALSYVVKNVAIKVECVFIGGYDNNIKKITDEYNLSDIVKFLPSMSYSESLQYLATADYSLIIEAVCDEGIYLPTKFVDALQTGVPVFCVSPANGTLHDYCDYYNVGYSCNNTDINSIEQTLMKAINDKITNKSFVPTESAKVFFNEYISKQYMELL